MSAQQHFGPFEAIGNLVRTAMPAGFLVAECRDTNGDPYTSGAKALALQFGASPDVLESLEDAITFVAQAVSADILNAEECAPMLAKWRLAFAKATGSAA